MDDRRPVLHDRFGYLAGVVVWLFLVDIQTLFLVELIFEDEFDLSAARFSDDPQGLALAEVEVYPVYSFGGAPACSKIGPKVFDF